MAYRRTLAIQARLDSQRQGILTAAAQLLADRGYAACSVAGVAGVAAQAGISTGSVYSHFARKSDLEADLFRDVADREVAAARDAVHGASTCTDAVQTGELPHQDANLAAAALVGAVGEALVGPLARGHQHVDLVPALVEFALRSVGGFDRVHA